MALKFLRTKQFSVFTIIVFGMIILSFVLWGGFQSIGTSPQALTKVNGEEISLAEYQRLLSRQLETYGAMLNQDSKTNKTFIGYIENQVANYLVTRKVLAQKAAELGIVVGQADVIKELEEVEAFQDPALKRFSPRVYEAVLKANQLNPRSFEQEIIERISGGQLQKLLEQAVMIGPGEITDRYRMQKASLDLQMAVFDPQNLSKSNKLALTEKDYEEYFSKHGSEFKHSEKRVLEVGLLDLATLPKNIAPTDDEVKSYYEKEVKNSKSEKWTKAQVHALHILISDNSKAGSEKASSLKKQIKSEQDFRRVAMQSSEDFSNAAEGGDLGYFDEAAMVKPFTDAAFKQAKLAQVHGPVKTDFGYHLIWVLDRASGASLDAKKGQIIYELSKMKSAEMAEKLKSEVSSDIAKKTGDQTSYLKSKGFNIFKTQPLDEKSPSREVPYTLAFKAMEAKVGEWQTLEQVKNTLYAYRVLEVQSPKAMTYSEARPQVVTKVQNKKAETMIKDLANQVIAKKVSWTDLKSKGATLSQHPKTNPYEMTAVPNFSSSETLLKAVQQLSTTAPISQAYYSEGKWVIFSGSKFSTPTLPIPAEEEKKIRDQIKNEKSASIVDDYIQKLVKAAKIPEEFKKKHNI